jgi:hypothetical protein
MLAGFGWLKNLSRGWALGGVVQLASDFGDYRSAGIGLRLRRYLGDAWSVEGSAGVFDADYGIETERVATPIFLEAGVSAIGTATFFARYEHHEFSYVRYISQFPPVALGESEVKDDVVMAGLRLGRHPRAIVIPAAIVGSLVILFGNASQADY